MSRSWFGLLAALWATACTPKGVDGVPDAGALPPDVVARSLVVNEVNCSGDDWVEVMNVGSVDLDLSEVYVTDDPATPSHRARFPPATVVKAGGFVALDLLDFGVSCDGDTVILMSLAGLAIDDVTLHGVAGGLTWGRLPDGDGAFVATSPTKAAPNRATAASDARINEIDCRGNEAIELVDVSDTPVDVSGFTLTLAPGDAARSYVLPAQSMLPPHGYLVVRQQDATHPAGFSFSISCGGETILLLDREGRAVDGVRVQQTPNAFTWGRVPDGTGDFVVVDKSLGAANQKPVDPTGDLFVHDHVATIVITMAAAAFNALKTTPQTDVTALFQYGSAPAVGVQVHVGGTGADFRAIDQKPTLKLEFADTARFRGLRHLKLDNQIQDPSRIHDVMAFDLLRALGVPAPRVGYATVTLNGQDYGLYAVVEERDRVMLDRLLPNTQHLYDAPDGADVRSADLASFKVNVGSKGQTKDLADLAAAVAAPVGGFRQGTSHVMRWDDTLDALAADAFLGHTDGYGAARANYLLHADDNGQFRLLPGSFDHAFHDDVSPFSSTSLLLAGCLGDAGCKRDLAKAMVAVVDRATSLNEAAEADALLTLLATAAAQDSRHGQSPPMPDAVADLKTFLAGRSSRARAEACAVPDVPGCP